MSYNTRLAINDSTDNFTRISVNSSPKIEDTTAKRIRELPRAKQIGSV